MDHRDVNPRFAGYRQFLVVFAQPSAAAQPSEGALHNPSSRQYLKGMAVFGTLDYLQDPPTDELCPFDQRPSISSISPDQPQSRKSPHKLAQHELCSITVLNICWMNYDSQQQSHGVHHDVALTSFHLLACVVAPWPPFSVVLTVWLSMMAALGVASRPCCSLSLQRRTPSIRSHVPSLRQVLKYHQTVPQAGRSCGIMRQLIPPRSTYRIPLTTSRRSALRGRPPRLRRRE